MRLWEENIIFNPLFTTMRYHKYTLIVFLFCLSGYGFAQKNNSFSGVSFQLPNDWVNIPTGKTDEFYAAKAGTLADFTIKIIESNDSDVLSKATIQFLMEKTTLTAQEIMNAKTETKITKNAKFIVWHFPIYSAASNETFDYRFYMGATAKRNFLVFFSEIVAAGSKNISLKDEEKIIESLQ